MNNESKNNSKEDKKRNALAFEQGRQANDAIVSAVQRLKDNIFLFKCQ